MGVITLPAPTGGINTAAGIADGKTATDLYNWVPRIGYMDLRYGVAAVNNERGYDTLHEWVGADATVMIVASSSTSLYKITTAGVATSLKTAQANAYWLSTQFQNKTILCNGANTPQVFNGTTVADLVTTGVTASTLWGCHTFKGRVYYWKYNDQSFWYAAAGSYQGALTEFPLNTVTSRGGFIVSMVTIQQQGGEGADDLAVFLMSTGELIIYQGDDPAAARSWQMIGKMQIGKPLSQYSVCKVGPTVFVWTTDGVVDLQRVLVNGALTSESVVSVAVGGSISTSISYTDKPSCCAYLPSEALYVTQGFSGVKFVYETNARAWTKFLVNLGVVSTTLSDITSFVATIGGELYFSSGANAGSFGGLGKYSSAAYADAGYSQSVKFPNILAYSKQGYVKLTNGRVGTLTTCSPRTNYDRPQYLAVRAIGDMGATTWDFSDDTATAWYTSDPNTTPVTLATALYSGVTRPEFPVTLASPAESFAVAMYLSQQRAKPVRWYETRIGWKMGGSR